MLWLIWLIVAMFFVILELFTGTFYMLVLGISGLLGMAGALLHAPVWVQLGIFAVSAFLLYAFAMPLGRRLIPASKETLPSPSQLIGQKAHVIRDIVPGEGGLVRVNTELWSAFADESIAAGEVVTIEEVKVSKLYVKKGQV
ncbi:NfeD family protein [Paenibacillus ferrarius]|uniref:NfeD family protein n=1 Tax=Paenibacillus ferrarius TaxID=1469647 RepID=UPI003D2CFAC8